MIGLLDLTADEGELLVRVAEGHRVHAEGHLVHGGLVELPYWEETGRYLSVREFVAYRALLTHGLFVQVVGMAPTQVMPTRDAVPFIRFLQGKRQHYADL